MNRIKHVLFLGALVALAGIGERSAFAVDNSLQDLWFNADGSFTDYTSAPISGVDLSSYDTTTGLGTITFTDTTAGADYFDAWFFVPVGTPFFNQYGTAVGSAAAGESWEIGDYNTGSIGEDAFLGSLDNTNNLTGTDDNYLNSCVGASCNGSASAALGDSYGPVVGNGDEEIITLTVSDSAPSGGFYLKQTNPDDNDNPLAPTSESEYFTLNAQYVPAGSTPPPATPEPSTWLLMLSGLSILAWRMRRSFALKTWGRFTALLAVAALTLSASGRAQSVLTVPWDPATPAAPHTAYPGANIVLGAVFTGNISGHSYTVSWNYGDGSAATPATAISNFNDISSTHIYVGTTVGQTWTAVATVSDTTASLQYTGNYLVIWENNTLQSRVNVAIDWGLWYLHQDMQHTSTTAGNWRGCASGYNSYSCGEGYGSLDAANVQAFEINGHQANGPASDPYTSDVAEGLADMISYITLEPAGTNTYTYNPATANFGCSNGTSPTNTNSGAPSFYCTPPATPVYYSAGATSCGTPPCAIKFDGNSNGKYAVTNQYETWGYEQGMFMDALVASGAPALTAATLPAPANAYGSGVESETFQNLVQDFVDGAGYCQYGSDPDVQVGYIRGDGYSAQGGGWLYDCQEGDDNSTSQWSAIGLIAAQRGFGITVPPIITDTNNAWVTNSQNTQSPDYQLNGADNGDTVDNPSGTLSYDYGGFGYRGSLYYSQAWGPWAVTPSGMVQMSLDGIGRTNSTAFGNASTDPDQRFNAAESYYADNFCDPLTGSYSSAYYTPRNYTYGLFSFTKSMLLHNPAGTLTPIQYLRTATPNVFTTNSSVPPNTIDWYAALSPANGGTDPCDGVAQTIVGRQVFPGGYWYGDNYDNPDQSRYETAWSIIMLQKSVFVTCVNNLGGAGTSSGSAPARIDLTWTGIPTAIDGYEVLRGTTSGGPYTEVGTTATTAYSDRTGLTNGDTYYYVLEPLNGSGVTECQSNQAKITVPNKRTF